MGRPKKVQPAPGGSVQDASSDVPQVREQIKNLSGFASTEELRDAIPDSTAGPDPEVRTRRPRRSKAEMEASRGMSDTMLEDKRYAEACANMAAFGGAR